MKERYTNSIDGRTASPPTRLLLLMVVLAGLGLAMLRRRQGAMK